MSESKTEYTLIDIEDGEETKVVFIHNKPPQLDDEILIYEEGYPEPHRTYIPMIMASYIEGLFNGDFRLKPANQGETDMEELVSQAAAITYIDDVGESKPGEMDIAVSNLKNILGRM